MEGGVYMSKYRKNKGRSRGKAGVTIARGGYRLV